MTDLTKLKPTSNSSSGAINPFARALAETEQSLGQQNQPTPDQNSLFSQALSQTGGKFAEGDYDQAEAMRKQQEEAEKQRLREIQRKKLHDQINPVDTIKLFDAREKRVKEELEKTRQELHMLAQEVGKFYKEVDIASFQQVVNPGQEAKYYISFFQKLRAVIMLLRQKVHSARTWMQQAQAKSAKKKKQSKFGAGLDMGGNFHEQGKSIFDAMHNERSNAYSGG